MHMLQVCVCVCVSVIDINEGAFIVPGGLNSLALAVEGEWKVEGGRGIGIKESSERAVIELLWISCEVNLNQIQHAYVCVQYVFAHMFMCDGD